MRAQSDETIQRAIAAQQAFQQGQQLQRQGKTQEALTAFQAALQRFSDPRSRALTFDLIAALHQQRDETLEALAAFQQALPLRLANPRDEAATRHNIGVIYSELGDKRQALLHLERARQVWLWVNDQAGLAATLNALGALHSWAGQRELALQFYEAALPLKRATKDRSGEAYIHNNLGALWSALGEKRKAREQFLAALAMWRATSDRKGQALAHTNLGVVWAELGERQKALESLQQALALRRALADRSGEARTLSNLGLVYALLNNKPRALEALHQSLALARTTNSLDDEAAALHHLMLSWKQFAQPESAITFGKLTINVYQQLRAQLPDTQWQQSFVKSRADAYRTLAEMLIDAGRLLEAQQVLRLLKAEEYFAFVRGDDPKNNTARIALTTEELEIAKGYLPHAETKTRMTNLAQLPPGTAAVFTLVSADKYRVLLFTADVRIARETAVSAPELHRKIQSFRAALNTRRPDFLPLARELYRLLIAPIRKDLEQSGARTLLWSLDGALRYVPLAALHDGENYFVERYPNVVLTLSSRGQPQPCSDWRGLGVGLSKAVSGFPALAHVPTELAAIIREQASGKGLLEGRILLDEAFTAAALQAELQRRYPAVHIASHFKLEPGNETDSYLVLGDGTPLTLAELKRWPQAFAGVQLLTLSACETGLGDGREVESFGELAQRQGAQAVLATLARVPDQSTALLMQQFYRQRATLSNAEALRQAQLALLQSNQFKHPAYWASFVLFQ